MLTPAIELDPHHVTNTEIKGNLMWFLWRFISNFGPVKVVDTPGPNWKLRSEEWIKDNEKDVYLAERNSALRWSMKRRLSDKGVQVRDDFLAASQEVINKYPRHNLLLSMDITDKVGPFVDSHLNKLSDLMHDAAASKRKLFIFNLCLNRRGKMPDSINGEIIKELAKEYNEPQSCTAFRFMRDVLTSEIEQAGYKLTNIQFPDRVRKRTVTNLMYYGAPNSVNRGANMGNLVLIAHPKKK